MKNLVRYTLISLGLMGAAQLSVAAGDPEAGRALAGACAACHGITGNSTSPAFPKIAGLGERYLLQELQEIQSGERQVPEMTGILDGMSERDLVNLAAYFANQPLQISGATEVQVQLYTGEKVDGLALGARLYRGGNPETGVPACTGCHSPRGLGNSAAGYPRLGGQHAAYLEEQLRAFRAGERTNDRNMIMRTIASRMSDAEIIAVSHFIAGLH